MAFEEKDACSDWTEASEVESERLFGDNHGNRETESYANAYGASSGSRESARQGYSGQSDKDEQVDSQVDDRGKLLVGPRKVKVLERMEEFVKTPPKRYGWRLLHKSNQRRQYWICYHRDHL